MSLVDHLINNMTSGELTPYLKSRGDLDLYQNGLETLLNAKVLPYGGVQRRMGFEFIAEGKFTTSAIRLIPFQYSEEQAYVLELGHNYIRFYTAGGKLQIESTGCAAEGYVYGKEYGIGEIVKYNCLLYVSTRSNSDKVPTDTDYWEAETSSYLPYEIASPYSASDLFSTRFTQSADVLYTANKNYQVRKLLRYGVTDWEMQEVTFTGGPYLADNTAAIAITPGGLRIGQNIDIISTEPLFKSGHVGALWKLTNGRSAKTIYKRLSAAGTGGASDPILQGGGVLEVIILGDSDYWNCSIVVQRSYDNAVTWYDTDFFDEVGVSFLTDDNPETLFRVYAIRLDAGQVDVRLNQLSVTGSPGIVRITDVLTERAAKGRVLEAIQSSTGIDEDEASNALTNPSFSDNDYNTNTITGWTIFGSLSTYGNGHNFLYYSQEFLDTVKLEDFKISSKEVTVDDLAGLILAGPGPGGISQQATGLNAANNYILSVEIGYYDDRYVTANDVSVAVGSVSEGSDIVPWTNLERLATKKINFVPGATSVYVSYRISGNGIILKRISLQDNENTSSDKTFVWAEGAWSGVRGYPRAITFHEQRLMLAGTDYSPLTIWGSQTGDFENFKPGANDSDSVEYVLNATDVNLPRWLTSWIDLHVGTQGGEWRVTGNGSALTPSNVNALRPTTYGSSDVQALQIGKSLLFVDRNEVSLRELKFDDDTKAYGAPDLAKFAEHLTKSGIRDIAYQQKPEPAIWCVLNNGNIARVTYMPSQNVLGWSEYDTQGEFQSIAIIPSLIGGEDEVWVSVARTINGVLRYYIERKKLDFWEEEEILTVDDPYVSNESLYYDSFPQTITLICETANAEIWYTLDGTDPSYKINGTEYNGPFSLTEQATIKARAYIVRNYS